MIKRTLMLSNVSIWVQPVAIALSMAQQENSYDQ